MFDTAKTAIGRKGPSVPARRFAVHILERDGLRNHSVLDWGCGKGADINWFAELGLYAVGYDPTFRPWNINRDRVVHMQHDFITCFYVLNVVPIKRERVRIIRRAAEHLAPNGQMFIAVRARRAIDTLGKKWEKHRDGYRTSKNTFQHGFTDEELKKLVKSAGMCYTPWSMAGFVGAIAQHHV